MYSRVACVPSGRRTLSRLTCRSLPRKTSSDASLVSTKCSSSPTRSPQPIAGGQEIAIQLRLLAARLRTPIVAPPDDWRQRHENRLGTPVRLQPEDRPSVVDEIELDIASAAIRLKIALALAVGQVLAPQQHGNIGVEKAVAYASGQCEAMLEVAIVEIVEKYAADAARLVAVLEEKITVAPALEARVVILAKRLQRVAADAVKMHCVFLEAVIRRQIHAAAEPPRRLRIRSGRVAAVPGARLRRHEHPHVHVHRRRVGIERMQHERDAHDFEAEPRQMRPRRGRRRRQPLSLDVRKIHAPALEHLARLDDPAETASAFGSRPGIAREAAAVDRLKSQHDAILQPDEVFANARDVHARELVVRRPRAERARAPMSPRYCMPSKWMLAIAAYAARCPR